MCGIFGIIHNKTKQLDVSAFNVLGIENDSRGGDSCGIFIDGKVEYGIQENKLYKNFFQKSKILKPNINCRIALGHCRKASVGAINEANAQPVVIKDEKEKIEFVLIHNGTIVNYREMAKKYIPEVDITNMTDSQVMARIFYYSGYEVLKEYIGAGVFVIVDYRGKDPQVLMFKGKSLYSSSSLLATTERPLFCIYDKHEFIFSSLSTYLKAIHMNETVYFVPDNILLEVTNKGLKQIEIFDRSNCYQTQPETHSNYYQNCGWYNYYNNRARSVNGNYPVPVGSMICNDDLLFKLQQKLCHGKYNITKFGCVYDNPKEDTMECWCWRGVLLKNKECFMYLENTRKAYDCTPYDLCTVFPELITYLSVYPVLSADSKFKVVNEKFEEVNYTGEVKVPLMYSKLIIKDGDMERKDFTNRSSDNMITELSKFIDYNIDEKIIENFNYESF